MKKAALAILLTVSLAGCASLPHPGFVHRHHKAIAAAPVTPPPVVMTAPVVPAAPPTFSERFRGRWKRLKWAH